MTELHKITHDHDPLRDMAYLQVQVDDTLALRLYSDFTLLIIDDHSAAKSATDGEGFTYLPSNPENNDPNAVAGFEMPVAEFARSYEALMAEAVERYGARPA